MLSLCTQQPAVAVRMQAARFISCVRFVIVRFPRTGRSCLYFGSWGVDHPQF